MILRLRSITLRLRKSCIGLLSVAAGLAVLAACRSLPAEELRQEVPVAVALSAVPLNGQHQTLERTGLLRYRGGLQISADDAHFGGLSGLEVSPDGARFTAISDMGYWVRGRLDYDNAGNLVGVSDVRMGPLRDPNGRRPCRQGQGRRRGHGPRRPGRHLRRLRAGPSTVAV